MLWVWLRVVTVQHVDHYSRNKCIAEQMVITANGNITDDSSELSTCTLHCAGIYGEGETRHLPRIVVRLLMSFGC